MTADSIVLIVVDTLRADHLGCYGYRRNTSPNMDRLAEDSVRFTRYYSNCGWTLPAFTSILTGLYPLNHEIVCTNADMEIHRLPAKKVLSSDIATLPEILQWAGYTSAACDQLFTWVHHPNWFARGYEFYINVAKPETPFYSTLSHNIVRAEEVNNRVLAWLDSYYKERFFLHIHYWDPHTPYDPPATFRKRFENDSFFKSRAVYSDVEYVEGCGPAERIGKKEKNLITNYDREIAYLDVEIGKVIARMKKLGIYDESLILFLSDHGEIMVDAADRYFGHTTLYEGNIKVPLLIKLPNQELKGAKFDGLAQHVDLFPTILDVAEIKAGLDLDGRSLLPLIKGDQILEEETAYAFGNYANGVPSRSIWIDRWKFIKNYTGMYIGSPSYFPRPVEDISERELYELENDPKELNNLVEVEKNRAREMERRLVSWISHHVGSPWSDPILQRF